MGDDWEEDDWEAADLALPGSDAPASAAAEWSDEEGHDAHKEEAAPIVAAAPAKPKEKTGLSLKIEEREKREADEAKIKAELREKLAISTIDTAGLEGVALEKARQQQMQEAADMDNAIDAFGISAAPSEPAACRRDTSNTGSIDEFKPLKEADFEQLAGMINKKMSAFEGQKGHMTLLKALLRASTSNMCTEDCKDLSAFTSVIYNDKVKADRDRDKKGKKSKGKKTISAGKGMDADAFEGGDGGGGWRADDDFDFM